MRKRNRPRKTRFKNLPHLPVAAALVAAAVIGLMLLWKNNNKNQESVVTPVQTEEQTVNEALPEPLAEEENVASESPSSETQAPKPAATQWPVELTMQQSSSITVVVNKKYKLPSNFVPSLKNVAGGSLRPEAADALQSLMNDASANGVPMSILSSYRSYSTQVSTYNKWVAQDGRAAADRYSARPGHSEHQTGLAVDLGNGTCNLETCFGSTVAGQWLASNSHKYGFIIRYPDGKESLTGYQYEPWHLRFVGVDTATKIAESDQTMDQYFGVEAGGY